MGRRTGVVSSSSVSTSTRIGSTATTSPAHATRSIGKRKRATAPEAGDVDGPKNKVIRKSLSTNPSEYWKNSSTFPKAKIQSNGQVNVVAVNEDEDSSSNEGLLPHLVNPSNKLANNASILLNRSILNTSVCSSGGPDQLNNSSLTTDGSMKLVYSLQPSMVYGTVLTDLKNKSWRLGEPIGKGNFGEIFVASNECKKPVIKDSAKYVVKIEPHSNGPLFVEIHCLMNAAKKDAIADVEQNFCEEKLQTGEERLSTYPPSGIPAYIASGSHSFDNARYRFLVLPRFDRDLHSLIRKSRVSDGCLLKLAIHIITVLENLHDRGYCHNDVKAQNLMLSKCKYLKAQAIRTCRSDSSKESNYEEHDSITTNDSHSSEDDEEHFNTKRNSLNKRKSPSHSRSNGHLKNNVNKQPYEQSTCLTSNSKKTSKPILNGSSKKVQLSQEHYARSLRSEKQNFIDDEFENSHFLRPTKRISYSQFFNEENTVKDIFGAPQATLSDDDNSSEEFLPNKKSGKKLSSSKGKRILKTRANIKAGKGLSKKKLTFNDDSLISQSKRGRKKQLTSELAQSSLAKTTTTTTTHKASIQQKVVEEERVFLIDFGLASKYIDNGVHRPFIMDQRRAHDGTLEFTSRDAHLGAHSRRSDLECLGYNLLFWSQGFLPWKDAAAQQQLEKVHRSKELLMTNVKEMLKKIYGNKVPKYLGEFLHLVDQLAYHERPDYERYRNMFKREYENLGYDCSKMQLSSAEIRNTCVRFKAELKENENCCYDILEMINKPVNLGNILISESFCTPQRDKSMSNRISPKNLRSKSDKKSIRSEFCWAEVLAQDPDQIARERAEKELEREETELSERPAYKYQGKPTYAILKILERRQANATQNQCNISTDRDRATETEKLEVLSFDEQEDVLENNIEQKREDLVSPSVDEDDDQDDQDDQDDELETESDVNDSDEEESDVTNSDATTSSIKSIPNKLSTPKGCVETRLTAIRPAVSLSTRTRNSDYAPKSKAPSSLSTANGRSTSIRISSPENHQAVSIKKRIGTRRHPRDSSRSQLVDEDSNSNPDSSDILSVSTVWNKFDKFNDYVKMNGSRPRSIRKCKVI